MTASSDPRSLLYRADALDPDRAKALTADILKTADDGELYMQYSASEAFAFDDGRLKTADYRTVINDHDSDLFCHLWLPYSKLFLFFL